MYASIIITYLKITEAHYDAVEPEVSKQFDILLGGTLDRLEFLDQLR